MLPPAASVRVVDPEPAACDVVPPCGLACAYAAAGIGDSDATSTDIAPIIVLFMMCSDVSLRLARLGLDGFELRRRFHSGRICRVRASKRDVRCGRCFGRNESIHGYGAIQLPVG